MKRLLIAASAAAILSAAAQPMAQSNTMASPSTPPNSMSPSPSQGSMSQGSMSQSGAQMSSDQSGPVKKHKKTRPATSPGQMSAPNDGNNSGNFMGTQPSNKSDSMSNPN